MPGFRLRTAADPASPAIARSRWSAAGRTAAAVLALALVLGFAGFEALGRGSGPDLPPLADGDRFVFLPSGEAGQVTVVDGKSDRVVAALAVIGKPHQVVLSDPTGTMVVSFAGQRLLQIVDLAQPAREVRLELPLAPEVMVASPDGYLLALADGARGSIAVVSLHQRKLLFEVAGFKGAHHLTFSSDGSQLYVTGRNGQQLELDLIDVVQQSVIRRVPLVPDGASDTVASALTRTPDGRHGFIALADSNAVLVLDLSTWEPVRRLAVGRSPSRPYGTADGRLMLVANEGDGSVSIIDTQALAVGATLPSVRDVASINTGWFESLAFVTSRTDRRMTVLDLIRFTKLADIELPAAPGAGVVNSTGQKLYVSLADTDQLAVVDTQRHALASVVRGAGRRPAGALMARSNNYCH